MADPATRPSIHVVAGALIDRRARVLIAQRPAGKLLAGGWEFPGGKLEPGEGRAAGLARELEEELGIVLRHPRPLIRVSHSYPHGDVLIDLWVVTSFEGEPRGQEGQALRWCALEDLPVADLLPADRPIVRALRLPERLTQRSAAGYRVSDFAAPMPSTAHADSIRHPLHGILARGPAQAIAAAQAGADFLVLHDAWADLQVRQLCSDVPVPVFVRGENPLAAYELGASGLNRIDA